MGVMLRRKEIQRIGRMLIMGRVAEGLEEC